ncbi:hypothetical protein [Mesorhizobium sp. M7A.F.Ca.CA.002.12.1.1]|uniref:hypothetical protein n=1 Tax=Mesorhizobium sp. M7A.F.Ca.CA.002.12.1.1 TaxID=2496735 RepID=UPI000FCA831F|nr:hypothetical protein [Mesorhizobium sp. M7A.F.Ca.CA.002.12.1.1]RUX60133.1 hypothetical protein EN989_10970 [Mesorhizobium sp. M7A.F.Ca.CA.002.12.1.1]
MKGPNIQNIPVRTPEGKAIKDAFLKHQTKYRLSRDVVVRFRGDYDVHAPAGTPVQMIPDGMGKPGYAIPPGACTVPGIPQLEAVSRQGKSRKVSIFDHDSTYYYIWAPADAVEEIVE